MASAWSARNGNYWQAGVYCASTATNATHYTLTYAGQFRSDSRINVMGSIGWNCWMTNASTWNSNTSSSTTWIESENDKVVNLARRVNFTVARGTADKTLTCNCQVKVTTVSSGTQKATLNFTIPKIAGMVKIYNGSGPTVL